MAVKVRLRALRIRALEAGPGRLVFSLGEGASLDPEALARLVQGSRGALRLTPEMKLVVHLGEDGRPAPPGKARRPRPGPPPSPAAQAAAGMELLAAARALLADLARCGLP
jgi:transcription-repair coupling factor (superfamily II helicase)